MTVRLSVIIVAFDMQRELPRTLLSLSPSHQHSIDAEDYEVIVVDNGSDPPVQTERGQNTEIIRIDNASPSPARAANIGIDAARGDLIGLFIDGARIASPGILHMATLAARIDTRPVITTMAFHLGPDVQMESIRRGYDSAEEDRLLEAIDWPSNGYRLFEISVFAGSSSDGWFLPKSESNAIFMPRELWTEVGGYDERFKSPGGGLLNLDMYVRCVGLPDIQHLVLLGEGTFHQVHGGIATNAEQSRWNEFHEEYKRIRGKSFAKPSTKPIYLGSVGLHDLPFIQRSAKAAAAKRPRES